ncbi:hypothetical protein CAL7716_085570 [Calothrix sp. PCC 7716]|nr:hypothetical protein CAL7716_085570 [Calothrix sp. PCC 7716]
MKLIDLRILYFAVAIPLNIAALIIFRNLGHIIGLGIIAGIYLYQWHRRLVYRTEFLHLAELIPTLDFPSKERDEAHKRLLELAKPNVIPVHEIAAAFDEMNRLEAKIRENKQQELARGLEVLRKYIEEDNDDAIEL